MTTVVGEVLLLVIGGVVAGAIGAAGGITSLVSYPTLLLAGVPPLPANVANLVAGAVCWPGSALTSRRELRGTGRALRTGLPVAAVAAAAGAALLSVTPSEVFAQVVPFLVLLASIVLLAQPRLRALASRVEPGSAASVLPIGIVSLYGGYFGSGSGIVLLALALTFFDDRLPQANAIKNMLLGAGALASAVVFVIVGSVDWLVVAPLAAGLFVGSAAGPMITRRVPPTAARWTIGLLGIAFSIALSMRT